MLMMKKVGQDQQIECQSPSIASCCLLRGVAIVMEVDEDVPTKYLKLLVLKLHCENFQAIQVDFPDVKASFQEHCCRCFHRLHRRRQVDDR